MRSLNIPPAVETGLKRLTERLRETYEDAEIYLFGSYARGDWLEDSDTDILVVSKGFEGRSFPERVGEIRRMAPKNLSFEILAYTPRELRRAFKRSIALQDAATYWRKIL